MGKSIFSFKNKKNKNGRGTSFSLCEGGKIDCQFHFPFRSRTSPSHTKAIEQVFVAVRGELVSGYVRITFSLAIENPLEEDIDISFSGVQW